MSLHSHRYAARRFLIFAALAFVAWLAVPAIVNAATQTWPAILSTPVRLLAFLPAILLAFGALPRLWSWLLYLTSAAKFSRKHVSRADAATRYERHTLNRMKATWLWAEDAGVAGTRTAQVGRTDKRTGVHSIVEEKVAVMPRLIRVGVSPSGPYSEHDVAPGTTPTQWNPERVAAAIGSEAVTITPVNARRVRVTSLTRDPSLHPPPPGPRAPPTPRRPTPASGPTSSFSAAVIRSDRRHRP